MVDPASSEDASAPSDKAPANRTPPEAGQSQALAGADGAAFASTRQHVAGKQADDGTIERFSNTKLNIALINDPKNGPRFTMTKRESGLDGEGDAKKASDKFEAPAAGTMREAASSPPNMPAPSTIEKIAPSSARPVAAVAHAMAPEPAPNRPADGAETAGPSHEPATPAALLARVAPSGVPPAAKPPDKVPIDSSKTFIGHNGTYYDESWRWMDWRGTRRSWNWPAALSLGHWFAYRRLYIFAGLHLLWLASLAAAAVNDIPILGLVIAALLITGLAGVYGNTLYFLAFRRAVDHVTKTGKGSYEELKGQLAQAGGTSIAALGVMAVLSLTGIAGAIAVTYYLRGGFLFNLWPF